MRMYLPIIAALALSACGGDNLSTAEDYEKSVAWAAIDENFSLKMDANEFLDKAFTKSGPQEIVLQSDKKGDIRLWYEAPYIHEDAVALCRKVGIQHLSRDKNALHFVSCATVDSGGRGVVVSFNADNEENPFEGIIAE